MNSDLVRFLGELTDIAELHGRANEAYVYRNAIRTIRKLGWSIAHNVDKFRGIKLPGIGESTEKKILEYVTTGKSKYLDEHRADPLYKSYKELSSIIGVGPVTAREWVSRGIKSIADLRKAIAGSVIELNHMQKYGLRYHHDLLQRIPRAEVKKLGDTVCKIVKSIYADSLCEIVGSYRRQAPESGDIDIIVNGRFQLQTLEKKLTLDPNYVGTLSIGKQRFSFLYRGKYVRQVDILLLPRSQYWTGILYFTGSWEFNANMRQIAKSRGFKLNRMGLYRDDKLIRTTSEEHIFKLLGMEYVTPRLR